MSEERNLVLVTGASGYVGQAVCNALSAAGIDVVRVSRSSARSACAGQPIFVNTYTDLAHSTNILRRTSAVIHLADRADRRSYDRHNHIHAADLVTALTSIAADAGVDRFLFASSVYAEQPEKTLYGRSKRDAEDALTKRAANFRAAVSLRLPPLYGSGAGGMVRLLSEQIAKGRPLPLGCANQLRRFMGIDNFCDLILTFCRGVGCRGTYCPADPEPVSMKGLAREIAKAGGFQSRFLPMPFIDRLSPATIVTSARAEHDANRIAQDLNWHPPFSLSEQLVYLS